jgi:hypothetical protein
MIISSSQARLALLLCLHTNDQSGGDLAVRTDWSDTCVPPELLDRVNEILAQVPETRSDRVRQARADIADGGYSAADVADKIIARCISDSLR